MSSKNLWLNAYKFPKISSAKAVAIVKRASKAKKVGHGGTLDPLAYGVLPIAIGKATKTSNQWMEEKKRYRFQIKWGEFRDSDDEDGKITHIIDKRPTKEEIIDILPQFIGKLRQQPSKFSAIKINGKRAYKLARQSIEFAMPIREISIYSIKLASCDTSYAEFEAECSKGTYIRSLARAIAEKLDAAGYVSKLCRTKVGDFLLENSISLDLLKQGITYLGDDFLNQIESSISKREI